MLQYMKEEKASKCRKKIETCKRKYQQADTGILPVHTWRRSCPVQLASQSPKPTEEDGMQGGYGRYPTIYSYSITAVGNKVSSNN